jgi:diguanylate cyclase (GGDEF)-like protein/PAS domain S-box-containing protein
MAPRKPATDSRLTSWLRSDSAGARLARRLLLPAMVIAIVASWLRLKAEQIGWLSAESRASLFGLLDVILFGTLIWIAARLLNRGDVKHRQTEQALHEHMDRLATIIRTEPECVKIVDRQGRLVEMNPAGLAMLEVESLAEAQQWRVTEYLLPEYRAGFDELHQRVMRGETGLLEFEIRGRRGTRRWLETHAAPMRERDGSILGLLGITRDIGARKHAGSAQTQVLLFRDLLDRSNDMIYIADALTARLLDCNVAFSRQTGYSYEEVLQMSIWQFSTAAGGSLDWPERLERVRAPGSLVIESDYRCKNGAALPVEISMSYVAREPRPLLIAVIRDVTDRRHQSARIANLIRIRKMQSAISAAVLRMADRDQMLQEACRVATEVGGYEHSVITVVDPGGNTAIPKYRSGIALLPEPQAFRIGDGTETDASVTGRALRTGEVVVCNDLRRSEPPVLGREHLLGLGIRSVVALPLTVEGGRVGALTLLSGSPDWIQEEELILLQEVAATLAFGLRSQEHADAAQFLTYYDPLTGLAKRALFCERLNALLAGRSGPLDRPIVAAFDIHDLSGINDAFGRAVGDALVEKVAERMRLAVESDERIGYLGAGTFVCALRDLAGAADSIVAMINKAAFEQPFEVEGRSFPIECRSGLARYPVDGQDGVTLVANAEAALRQAKESGEQYLHFRLQMHSDVADRLQLEHRLREAIDAKQFVLHYQPQLSVATGRIEAVEALLRWRQPGGALALPASFLTVLESSGMIFAVGTWALTQASQDCARWRSRGLGPLRVAVNFSALQIRRRRFVEEVLQIVDGLGEEGYGLDVEITETSLLQNLDDACRKLRRLREAGIRIAIDDFGTGYSSLGLLPTLPVDILKIDRIFIQGLPSDRASVALTSSIVQIASAFGLVTVAEGVETAAQLEILRSCQCSQYQGYFHSRPMPVGDLESLLAAQTIATA